MKYIIQHTGAWDMILDSERRKKMSPEDINKIVNKMKCGDYGIKINKKDISEKLKDETVDFCSQHIKKMKAEDYWYANNNNNSEAHFLKGIRFGKKISEIENLLSEKDKAKLSNIFPDGNLKFWGSKSGNENRTKRKIKKIELGDRLILISTFNIGAICEIAYLVENRNIGEVFWDDVDYENIIFLKNIKMFPDLDINKLKQILHFSQNYNKISMHIVEQGDPGFLQLDCKIDEIFNI